MDIQHRQVFLKEATRYVRGPADQVAHHIETIDSTSGEFEDRLADDLRQKLVGKPADPRDATALAAFEGEVFEAVQTRHPKRVQDGDQLTVQNVTENDGVVMLGMNLPHGGGVTAYVDTRPGEEGGEIFISEAGANRLRWPQTVAQARDHAYTFGQGS